MRLRNFIHLDEIQKSSKPLTKVCKTTTNLKKKFARKNSMSFFLFLILIKSKKLMDKAKLLESKVKPEERASIQKNNFEFFLLIKELKEN